MEITSEELEKNVKPFDCGYLIVEENENVNNFTNPAQFVSEATTADELLSTFQGSHQHLGVVEDEYGGVSGVVTLEDVIEILTGEIVDETDKSEDLQEEARVKKIE